MRTLTTLIAVCFVAALVGCSNTQSTTSPGAVGADCCGTCTSTCEGDKAACCGTCGGDASPGAMSDSPCSSKSDCSSSCSGAASPGAMSDSPCSDKSDCSSKCPVSGASMGAVSEKSDCASSCSTPCGSSK